MGIEGISFSHVLSAARTLRRSCEPVQRPKREEGPITTFAFRARSLVLAMLFAASLLTVVSRPALAADCQNLFDPRYPGLQQCEVKVSLDGIEAAPPIPQKMSLWCWAASLAMIYSAQGHPISQESIVLQNYGSLSDSPGGSFLTFLTRINRVYTDDSGDRFTSRARAIRTPADAARSLDRDIPILYTTSHHAVVQLSMIYQTAPGGPLVFKGGTVWDPEPNVGLTDITLSDVRDYVAAWAITTD